MPVTLHEHAARLAALLHKSPVVPLSRLELLAEPAVLQQLIGIAGQVSLALFHQDLISPRVATTVFQRITNVGSIVLTSDQLFDPSILGSYSGWFLCS